MNRLHSPNIEINSISLNYEGRFLFDKLSFRLAGGRFTCLLGPSGVGKSSLLQLVAGILSLGARQGNIQSEEGLSLAGRVAYMGQTDLLLPWLSVLDNVLLGERLRWGRRHARIETKEKALHYLERVGLIQHIKKKPAVLSQGMRQRVALARTLFEDKAIVLMDEPFSALDLVRKLELQALAVEVLKQRTVFWVTHDPLEALRIADVIMVLAGRPAKIIYQAEPEGLVPRELRDQAYWALEAELLEVLYRAGDPLAC